MDMAAKCRTIFGATTAAGLGFVLQPPHFSDGSAAPVGFRDTSPILPGWKRDRGGNQELGRSLLLEGNKGTHPQYEAARGFQLSPG